MTRQLPKQQALPLNESRLDSFYLPTTDDWSPNFERETVRVSVTIIQKKSIRISVWGADDTGMGREQPLPEEPEPRELAIKLHLSYARNLPNPLTKQWLKEHCFWPA